MTMTRRTRLSTEVLRLVTEAGPKGVTWHDIAAVTGKHHGSASGALSHLNDEGHIARLRRKRGRASVYVLPEHVPHEDDVAPRRTNKIGPEQYALGRDAGLLEGHAKGYAEGMSKGVEDGWTEGYDTGVKAGRDIALREAETIGNSLSEPVRAQRQALGVVNAMLLAVDPHNSTITHRGECWRTHPACALRAVRRALV